MLLVLAAALYYKGFIIFQPVTSIVDETYSSFI